MCFADKLHARALESLNALFLNDTDRSASGITSQWAAFVDTVRRASIAAVSSFRIAAFVALYSLAPVFAADAYCKRSQRAPP